jgi:hypothetical protein
MTRKTKAKPKTPRAREYTGPNTLEDVKKFLETNATQKAKVQAMEGLPREDQVTLMEWIRKRTIDALDLFQKRMEEERKQRGFCS